ncbi:DUF6220 domain-containing protein [Catellatospora methionotrophica]|uniref:DUF6220 domain-containing protein n=1 Tax=Catellatospora methionotrophica TaxID=121620 RepID=UPI0033FEFCAA
MRKVFTAMAALLLLVVVAEFYFAASGAFGAATEDAAYRPHHVLGYVIFLLPLLMAAVAAAARLPRRLIWTSLLVTGMTSVQVVIAKIAMALGAGTPGSLVFGLHAVGGLALLASVVLVVRQARRLADAAPGGERGVVSVWR